MATYLVSNNQNGANNFFPLSSGDSFVLAASATFSSWKDGFETGIMGPTTGRGISAFLYGGFVADVIRGYGADRIVIGASSTTSLFATWGLDFTTSSLYGATRVSNAGTLYGLADTAIHVQLVGSAGANTTGFYLTNSGTIEGVTTGVDIRGATNAARLSAQIDNRGQIAADLAIYASGRADKILNSGTITGSLGAVTLIGTNSGDFAPTLTNSGTILHTGTATGEQSAIHVERGTSTASSFALINSGTIQSANFALHSDVDTLTILNTGRIIGKVFAESGTVTLHTTGTIRGTVTFAGGDDELISTGTIFGSVDMGGGNDMLDLRSGVISGVNTATGGLGDDSYYVSARKINILEALNGGTDTVYSESDYTLRDNFENLTLIGDAINGAGNALANALNGNEFGNYLNGMLGADTLYGNDGDDTLLGQAGGDLLFGGNGDDRLDGGAGREYLTGGTGADVFVFSATSHTTTALPDVINDFTQGEDLIDLSAIDANSRTSATNEAFTFLGTGAFTSTPGQLRVEVLSGSTYVRLDADGDGVAESSIRLAKVFTLSAADFLL
jgi:Ca2+-binding RTX toxin-like protein